MKITTIDKIKIVFSVYSSLGLFKTYRKRFALLLRPLDAPRYVEFAYLRKFLLDKKKSNMFVLDVSSPYIMSYILSQKNKVIKTDIDNSERKFINENNKLSFKIEDATKLSFANETFDLVYSVSVIEHIYRDYVQALREMMRVTKSGGYVYVTFPVSKEYVEEWSEGDVYEKQYKENNKTFFQYRFGQKQVEEIIREISQNNATVTTEDIFWERKEGGYDTLINHIKNKSTNVYVSFVKNVFVNMWYGFMLFPKNPTSHFSHAKSFGNMHLVIRKK